MPSASNAAAARERVSAGDDDKAKVVPLRGGKCAACGKPVVHAFRPFCSQRCADLDLGRWFNEDYRVAAEADAELDDDGFAED